MYLEGVGCFLRFCENTLGMQLLYEVLSEVSRLKYSGCASFNTPFQLCDQYASVQIPSLPALLTSVAVTFVGRIPSFPLRGFPNAATDS